MDPVLLLLLPCDDGGGGVVQEKISCVLIFCGGPHFNSHTCFQKLPQTRIKAAAEFEAPISSSRCRVLFAKRCLVRS